MKRRNLKALPIVVGTFLSFCILALLVIPTPTAHAGGALCGAKGCLWYCIDGFTCSMNVGECYGVVGSYQAECINLPI